MLEKKDFLKISNTTIIMTTSSPYCRVGSRQEKIHKYQHRNIRLLSLLDIFPTSSTTLCSDEKTVRHFLLVNVHDPPLTTPTITSSQAQYLVLITSFVHFKKEKKKSKATYWSCERRKDELQLQSLRRICNPTGINQTLSVVQLCICGTWGLRNTPFSMIFPLIVSKPPFI